MPRIRDFNPDVLKSVEDERIRLPWEANVGLKGKVSIFTIFLPRLLVTKEGKQAEVCTNLDEELLQDMLVEHFGGCTANQSPIQGIGRRGQELETNVHHQIEVLASLWRGTWPYFRALRRELQAYSGEQQILILHQHATIV